MAYCILLNDEYTIIPVGKSHVKLLAYFRSIIVIIIPKYSDKHVEPDTYISLTVCSRNGNKRALWNFSTIVINSFDLESE